MPQSAQIDNPLTSLHFAGLVLSRWQFLRSLFAVWITAALVGTSRASLDEAQGARRIHFGKSQTHETLLAVLQIGAKTIGPLREESSRPPDIFFGRIATLPRHAWRWEFAAWETTARVAYPPRSLVGTVELRI